MSSPVFIRKIQILLRKLLTVAVSAVSVFGVIRISSPSSFIETVLRSSSMFSLKNY